MARSMRARKEVDYSDPGELSITEIRRGISKAKDLKPKTAETVAGKSGEAQAQAQAKAQAKSQAQKQAPKRDMKQVSPTKKFTRRATKPAANSKTAAAADAAAPTTAKGKRKAPDVSGKPKARGGGGGRGGTASTATVDGAGDAGAAPAAKRRQVAGRARRSEGGGMGGGTSAAATDKENASGSTSTRGGSGSREEGREAEGGDARTAPRYVSTLEAPCPVNRKRPAPPDTRRRCGRDAERAPPPRIDEEDAPTPPQYVHTRKTRTEAGSESPPREKGASSTALPAAGGSAASVATAAPPGAAASSASSMATATSSSLSSSSPTSPQSADRTRSSKRRGVGSTSAPPKTGGSSSSSAALEGTPSRRRRSTAAHPSTPGTLTRDAAGLPLSPHTLQSSIAQQTFMSELGDILTTIETKAKGTRGHERGSSKKGAAASSVEGASGADEAVYWKARFDEVFALRKTDPEKELALIREHTAEMERKAEQCIAHLRKKAQKVPKSVEGIPATPGASSTTSTSPTVATAAAAATTAEATATATTSTETQTETAAEATEPDADHLAASSAYVRSLEEKIEHHRRVIRLYQTLSSLAIHPKKEGQEGGVEGGVMTCTAVNHLHRRAVRFDLKVPEDEESEDFAYRATGNAHLLPEYMRHDLLFTNKQCPLFLTKLLQNLFRT